MTEALSLETLTNDVHHESRDRLMQCMEVWGGSQLTAQGVQFGGLNAWVYSKPYDDARSGGDVYYASSCATGRITRFLLADVSGHGEAAAGLAGTLKTLMRRFVNCLDQGQFVRSLNRKFVELAPAGVFATAVVATFFGPTRRLCLCNAGHPRPLLYRAARRDWVLLGGDEPPRAGLCDMPLGLFDLTEYRHFDIELNPGDCVLLYSDALMEACGEDNEILGEDGLRRMLNRLGNAGPQHVVEALVREIAVRYPHALDCDDVTVMALQANEVALRFSFGEQVNAFKRLVAVALRALRPGAERPPFPDLNLANLGGAILPLLAKTWRASGPIL